MNTSTTNTIQVQQALEYARVFEWAGRQEASGTLAQLHSAAFNAFAIYLDDTIPELFHLVRANGVYIYIEEDKNATPLRVSDTPAWVADVLTQMRNEAKTPEGKIVWRTISGQYFYDSLLYYRDKVEKGEQS